MTNTGSANIPGDIHVLLLEGYCKTPTLQNQLAQVGAFGKGYVTKRVRVQHPDGTEAALREIDSGLYHAIVVVDLSNADVLPEFERVFGPKLQRFAQEGGVVAFPCSDNILVPTLEKFFDTKWQRTKAFMRTNWGPCEENHELIHSCFGNGTLARRILGEYSAKGKALRNVPVHERCFGAPPEARTQFGNDNDDDYNILIAMHNYGKGGVAYFGDANCEERTAQLMEAFVASRCPEKSIDCFAALDEDTFNQIKAVKEQGNAAFQSGKLEEAVDLYNKATDLYGYRAGSHGEQRDTLVTLYSNISMVYIKRQSWEDAEKYATKALALNGAHDKSLYRRAKSRYELSLSKRPQGDLGLLNGAKKDAISMQPGNKDRLKLLERIEAEMKRLEKKQKD